MKSFKAKAFPRFSFPNNKPLSTTL